ncbi:ferredoxin reductase family protein [Demequina flava]|uniref:ferredoxin reductase family protein n=1 Tax=Demequina flava TaxID=1095025 RepID=UPI000784DCEF|nr:ferric reductase-like transmembrane domain-containing protein [Demequina flava]
MSSTRQPALTLLEDRRRRSARRSWWTDGLEAAVWLAAVTGIALMIASGGVAYATSPADWLYAAGRAFGIVAAVLMMAQVLLASRVPWVERAIGHDRAIAVHTRWGKVAIVLMLVHLAIMTTVTASYDGRSVGAQVFAWPEYGWWMLAALVAATAFIVVLVTSLTAVRLRWPYERWHAVHMLVYIGVAFAVPHQFLEGSTFRAGGIAWWFWAVLWTLSIGSFVLFRLIRPVVRIGRHGLMVESVTPLADGSTTVTVAGRNLDRLKAQPGQFFLWRFLSPELRTQQHPYSLSAAPGDRLRITVKPSGFGSTAVKNLTPGTRVMVEGPLGIFTHQSRTRSALVLVAAGIGVTPVRSMLEECEPGDDVTVIVRARSRDEAPLLDEIEDLATARGATVHLLLGSRGQTWGTRENPASISDLVASPQDADVYICGPRGWAQVVAADALAAGVAPAAIHREEFGW